MLQILFLIKNKKYLNKLIKYIQYLKFDILSLQTVY